MDFAGLRVLLFAQGFVCGVFLSSTDYGGRVSIRPWVLRANFPSLRETPFATKQFRALHARGRVGAQTWIARRLRRWAAEAAARDDDDIFCPASLKLRSRIARKLVGSEGPIMAITSVASSTAYPSPAAAASATASAAKSPAVINSVSAQLPPGTGLSSVSDVQSAVDGLNALVENYARLDWSKTNLTPGQIAQAQSTEAEQLQAAEGAIIATADERGIQGVSFDFIPIDFPAPSGFQSSSIIAAAPQAAAATLTPASAATPAAAALSATPPSAASAPVAASSRSQANPQPSTPTLPSGAPATPQRLSRSAC